MEYISILFMLMMLIYLVEIETAETEYMYIITRVYFISPIHATYLAHLILLDFVT
jgi:hypothetical protein